MATREHTVKLPLPSQVVGGKYRIVERAGTGGMGLVFLGEELATGRRVALKFLDPEPSDDDSRLARFLREGKVGFEVQHPGAAELLDFGRDDSMRLFLCFEFVEGEDLRELLRREGRLPFAEAREVALRVAEVLAFAHGRDVVHRDIKPENLRVRRDGATTHVKVLDFGIAKLIKETGARLTGEGMLAGTPRYMAPEQVSDEPLDGGIDQYALGLVLFEMLTGAMAMPGRNLTQILMHQLQTAVPTLESVDPALASPEVDAFLAKACAKAREQRFATMEDFIAALRALRVDETRWPLPASTRAAGAGSDAPTRDGRAAPPSKGDSATYVRPLEPTQTETPRPVDDDDGESRARPEVPTEPERPAVARLRPTDAEPRAPAAAAAPAGEPTTLPPGREAVAPALRPTGAAPDAPAGEPTTLSPGREAAAPAPRPPGAEPRAPAGEPTTLPPGRDTAAPALRPTGVKPRAPAGEPTTLPPGRDTAVPAPRAETRTPAYPGDEDVPRPPQPVLPAEPDSRPPRSAPRLEVTTEPERPAVARRAPAPGRETVFGGVAAPAPAPRTRRSPWLLVALVALVVGRAAAWWLTHR